MVGSYARHDQGFAPILWTGVRIPTVNRFA